MRSPGAAPIVAVNSASINSCNAAAYSEFAGAGNTINCVASLDRAINWFTAQGITIDRILTDNGNGNGYRSTEWRDHCQQLCSDWPDGTFAESYAVDLEGPRRIAWSTGGPLEAPFTAS